MAYWKQKLSLRATLVGRPKGRSIKALRERVETLLEDKDTRTAGLLLNQYHEKVQVARNWRGGSAIAAMDDDTVDKNLSMFQAEATILPAEIGQALLKRQADRHASERNWKAYFGIMMPFLKSAEFTFDPKNPTMWQLPRVPQWKRQAFLNSFIDQLVCPFLFEGSSSAASIRDLSTNLLAALDGQDIMMMDKHAASLLDDLRMAFTGLITIIDFPFSSANRSEVEALAPRSSASSAPNPVEILASALESAPWFKERREKFLAAMTIIAEKEGEVEMHLEYLEQYDDEPADEKATLDSSVRLAKMHDDISDILQKVECEAMLQFSQELIRVTDQHMKVCMLVVDKQPALNDAWWTAVGKLLNSASIAYPLDQRVPTWQGKLQELRMSKKTKAILDAFASQLQAVVDKGSFEDIELETFIAACQRCQSGGTGITDLVQKALGTLVSKVLEDSAGECDKQHVEVMTELLRFVPESHSWHTVSYRIGLVIKVCSHEQLVDSAHDDLSVDLNAFRKDLEELRLATLKAKELAHIPSEIATDLHDQLDHVHNEYKKKNDALLQRDVQSTELQVESAKKELLKTAYGTGTEQAWNKDAKPNASLKELQSLGNDKGIFDLDDAALSARLACYKDAFTKWKVAQEACGSVVEPQAIEMASALQQRAVLTMVEVGLLRLAKDPVDADAARTKVQAFARQLRSEQMREKDVLPSSLYKWAFQAITGR